MIKFLLATLLSFPAFADYTQILPVVRGGTGQNTSNGALNALLPSQTANATKFLQTDGTNTSWQVASITTPAQEFWVSKDIGDDANNCSLVSPCKTIQTGINAANAISAYFKQTIVHVAPASGGTGSSYNENITFSQQGVNLICDAPQVNTRACLISGSITVNMTGTSGGANFVAASNQAYMSGFVVSVTGSADAVTFSGSTFQRFIVTNCYFDNNGTGSAAIVSNSGTSGGTPSALISYDTVWANNNATNPTVNLSSGARFWVYGTSSTVMQTTATNKSFIVSGASASVILNLVQVTGQVQVTNNTATFTMNLSTIASSTAACIDTPASPNVGYVLLSSFGCNSSNTNSITGSGVAALGPGNARFGSSGDIVSTVTQATIGPGLPQGEVMIGAGATTGTNVLLSLFGGHIKINQTTSPTCVVNANAGTGATCTCANATDTAGSITVTTGSVGTPATGNQCALTFNKAYGVAPICTFSPSSVASATNTVLFQVGTVSTASQQLVFNVAGGTTTAYTYTYHCLETK